MTGKIIQHSAKDYAGIPAPVSDVESLHSTVLVLQDIVETLVRQRGNINTSAVTVGDLIELGLIDRQLHRTTDSTSN